MSIPALKVTQLEKTYESKQGAQKVHALRGLSFEIQPGEIFGLLGPNGAGKTTIISITTTLEKASAGHVEVFGINPATDPLAAKRHFGVVPQEIINQGYFNLEEILGFQSGYYGLWKNKDRIHELLKDLDLWDHRKKLVKQLSGGMKRRLMIAKALVHQPKLLLLDEPTAGVDVELRKKLWDYVLKLKEQGVTVLLTTHYLAEAEFLCERVGILRQGMMPFVGETRSIVQRLTLREIEIELHRPLDVPQNHPLIRILEQTGVKLVIQCPHELGFGDVVGQLGIPIDTIKDVSTQEGSLEQAFINFMQSSAENPGGSEVRL